MKNIDSPQDRQKLFIELAAAADGVTANDVFEKAREYGDTATPEAYFNMGRRLAHKGILSAEKRGRTTVYTQGVGAEGIWLTENEIRELVDPDLPLLSLAALELNSENIRNIREATWMKVREILSKTDARKLFDEGIRSIADHAVTLAQDIVRDASEIPNRNDINELEESITQLRTICKQGLGLTQDAIKVPNADALVAAVRKGRVNALYNESFLADEISRRIEPGSFVRQVTDEELEAERNYLVAAIDGSCRSGITGYKEPLYDLSVGVAPDISVQTSVALINRKLKNGKEVRPVFSRLPEKPEDMQQQENKFTVMNRMFHPELTDSEYLHAISCAMDLLEVRTTGRMMRRWDYAGQEIPPAEVILRDGTLVPHDRNFSHYRQDDTYGRIVRELIERSWGCVAQAEADGNTLVGIVKKPQLSPMAPIINWKVSQVAAKNQDADLEGWPQASLNKLTDQQLLTRILTAGTQSNDPWFRSAVIVRPFIATSSFNASHFRSSDQDIPQRIFDKQAEALKEEDDLTDHERMFWENFRGEKDAFVQMISKVWYAYFFVGTLPRLDIDNSLPRIEFSLLSEVDESSAYPEDLIEENLQKTLRVLNQMGFDVSNEHSMFDDKGRLDLMPKLCIEAHNIAKDWMRDFMVRIKEYIGFHSRLFRQTRSPSSFNIHGYLKKEELINFAEEIKQERLRAGGGQPNSTLVAEEQVTEEP